MSLQLLLVLACGVIAILYGAWVVKSVLSRSAGTDRMKEIAAAIQEGAAAYLNRQYTTIGIVGLIIFLIANFVLTWQVALGFIIGATLSGAAGYIVKPFQAEQVRTHLNVFLDQAASGYEHVAEAPRATQLRLGINAERLLVYLNGFQNQVTTAGGELDALLARGEQAEAQLRIERLHTGCVTLGLRGAAAALRGFAAGFVSNDAVQAALVPQVREVDPEFGPLAQIDSVVAAGERIPPVGQAPDALAECERDHQEIDAARANGEQPENSRQGRAQQNPEQDHEPEIVA